MILTWLAVAHLAAAIVAVAALVVAAARQPHGSNYHPTMDPHAHVRRARQLREELDRAYLRDALNARPLPQVQTYTDTEPHPN